MKQPEYASEKRIRYTKKIEGALDALTAAYRSIDTLVEKSKTVEEF